MNNTYCSLAWNHQFIGPGGLCKPCCRFKKEYVLENNDKYDLATSTINEIFHSEFMNDIRANMLIDEPIEGCKKCYEEEAAGKNESLRQTHNKIDEITENIDLRNPKIIFLEFAFSNICNLQCVMCGSYFSTSWIKQDTTGIMDLTIQHHKKYDLPNLNSIKEVIPDLTFIKFTGGEPLLISKYYDILIERAKHPNFENCSLVFCTNLTFFPSDELLDIWSRCKHVVLSASLDGIENVAEYIRYPTEWEDVSENIIKYLKLSDIMDIRVGIRPTIMPYNILSVIEFYEWWEVISSIYYNDDPDKLWSTLTHVAQPEFLSLQVLDKPTKEFIELNLNLQLSRTDSNEVKHHVEHLIKYMNLEDNSHLLNDFKRYTKVMDKRGLTFKDLEPDLYEMIFGEK
jgi:hypothetical protein